MKKLTTLALAALLSTVTATSVFAAGTTQNTTVGYTAGGINPGNGTYTVVIPKQVVITGTGTTGAADMSINLKPTGTGQSATDLPEGLSVGISIKSANNFKLTTDQLTNVDQKSVAWKFVYGNSNTEIAANGGTTGADPVALTDKLTPNATKITASGQMDTAPTVIVDGTVTFTDTVTFTVTEEASGIA